LEFFKLSLYCLLTGGLTGVVFAILKLPIPAPPIIQSVFGIFGLTIGYLLVENWNAVWNSIGVFISKFI
jgi:XapX domain-containing protein